LTASNTSNADNVSDEEPVGHVDDAACEREFLGHLLDAMKTMLPSLSTEE
jgi:hypothetical protein